jgi:phosphatidylserine decarboxylase
MPLSPSRVAATSLRVLPRKRLSQALGRLARLSAPEAVLGRAVELYCRAYGVDLTDCVVPAEGFGSFDAFFTRKLRAGVRPIDSDPRVLVSPADGKLEAAGPLDAEARLLVKGREYTAAELLGDASRAHAFAGGQYALVYLSPRDYHRVHAPVDGRITQVQYVPGTLLPVNNLGVNHFPKLFARNERVVFNQHSATFGPVTSIMVGAIGVGRISVAFDASVVTNDGRAPGVRDYGASGPDLARGDELGVFHLGSTAIVFVSASSRARLAVQVGDAVRLGQPLLRAGGA